MGLDQQALDILRDLDSDGSQGVFAQLVDAYIGDAANLLANIKTALAEKDAVSLKRHAHTLKSTSASLGASRVSQIATEIETIAKSGELSSCALFYNALLAEHAVAVNELKAECAAVKQPVHV